MATRFKEPKYLTRYARFGEGHKYRYELTRSWDTRLPTVAFIMLNPSTADEYMLDPTLRRCLGYAMRWGYGSMSIVNLFALRSTDPKALYKAGIDPVGPENDKAILAAVSSAGLTVAAWGNHGGYKNRAQHVCELVADMDCLALTKSGHPAHPLYLRSDLEPIPFPWSNT